LALHRSSWHKRCLGVSDFSLIGMNPRGFFVGWIKFLSQTQTQTQTLVVFPYTLTRFACSLPICTPSPEGEKLLLLICESALGVTMIYPA